MFGGGGLFGQSQPQQQGPAFGNQSTTQSMGGVGSLFGTSNQAPAPGGGGLFGAQQQQPPQTGGLFGGATTTSQQGGLFGAAPQQSQSFGSQPQMGGGGGLFGQQPQQQPQQNGGLFGGPPVGGGGGLFGQSSQQPQNQTGGLFGGGGASTFGQQQPQQSGGLFGQQQPPQQQQFPSFGGGLFGQGQQQGQQQGQGGGLFGAQQQPQNQGGGLFGQQNSLQRNQTITPGWQNTSNSQPQMSQFNSANDDSLSDINLDPNTCTKIDDSISNISWCQQQPRFVAISTWEGKVRVYELTNNRVLSERKIFQLPRQQQQGGFVNQQQQQQNPVLCLDWKSDASMIFCGCGGDNVVYGLDIQSGQCAPIGQHNGAVINVFWIEQVQMVISISMDSSLKVWNFKQPGSVQFQLAFNHKPIVSDFNFPMLIIGFTQEKISIININQLLGIKNVHYFDSPLGQYSQLTTIALFPSNDGFGIGSIDGRGHMSNIIIKSNTGYGQQQNNNVSHYELKNIMTFKAHKVEETPAGGGKTQNYFYPVNSVQFNCRNQKFLLTAGGEGQMIFWDYDVKNKIRTFNFNNVPISCTKMSQDGTLLAYALSNDFSKGPEGYQPNSINKLCIHFIADNELKSSQR